LWAQLAIKTQIVYETNIDYEATYSSLYRNSLLDNLHQTQKGLIWFRFKNTQTIFMISPDGKMQVKWNDTEEKKILLKLLKSLLIADKGHKLRIKPAKQQVWVPYPPPEPLKLFWCDEETTYIRCPRLKRFNLTLLEVFKVVMLCFIGFCILQNLENIVMSSIANLTQPGTELIKILVPVYPYLALAPAIAIVFVYVYTIKFRETHKKLC
jgi:hypothetical protein